MFWLFDRVFPLFSYFQCSPHQLLYLLKNRYFPQKYFLIRALLIIYYYLLFIYYLSKYSFCAFHTRELQIFLGAMQALLLDFAILFSQASLDPLLIKRTGNIIIHICKNNNFNKNSDDIQEELKKYNRWQYQTSRGTFISTLTTRSIIYNNENKIKKTISRS